MSETRTQLLQDFLSVVLWRLTLARCTDVGEFTHFMSVLIAEFSIKIEITLYFSCHRSGWCPGEDLLHHPGSAQSPEVPGPAQLPYAAHGRVSSRP